MMQEQIKELYKYSLQPDLQRLYQAVSGAAQGNTDDQALDCGAMIWSAFASPAGIP